MSKGTSLPENEDMGELCEQKDKTVRAMDPNAKEPAVARRRSRGRSRRRSRGQSHSRSHHCYRRHHSTGLEIRVPWQMELRPRRAASRCVRCYNHGFTDQIKNHMHFCTFQTCTCPKCAFFSEHGRALPDESALQGVRLTRQGAHLTQSLVRSVADPPKDRDSVKKFAVEAEVFGNLPRGSADWRDPRIFVSVLEPSSLEEETDNVSYQGLARGPYPVQHAPTASEQIVVSAISEWQQMLDAAKALMALRFSSRARSGPASPLQLCIAPAPAGDGGLPSSSPSR